MRNRFRTKRRLLVTYPPFLPRISPLQSVRPSYIEVVLLPRPPSYTGSFSTVHTTSSTPSLDISARAPLPPSLPFPGGRALARPPLACSSVTGDAAVLAATAVTVVRPSLGQWKMRASLPLSPPRSHAQSVRRRSRRGSQLDARGRTDGDAGREEGQNRQDRTDSLSQGYFYSTRRRRGESPFGRTDGPRGGRTDGRFQSPLRPTGERASAGFRFLFPFSHSALLHNSNVD